MALPPLRMPWPGFLRGLDRRGKRFVADVHKDQRVCLEGPQPCLPEWSGRGRRPTRPVTAVVPVRVDAWAAARPASGWQRLVLREAMRSLNDLVTAIAHMLPGRQMTAPELADILSRRHEARRAAKASHARKQRRQHPHPTPAAGPGGNLTK
ncbi:MAG: hypothetical protein Q8O33_13625 [Pseudomonadota bacterium]|nr:hypothetical protein [Pseudomonadota bacterium]